MTCNIYVFHDFLAYTTYNITLSSYEMNGFTYNRYGAKTFTLIIFNIKAGMGISWPYEFRWPNDTPPELTPNTTLVVNAFIAMNPSVNASYNSGTKRLFLCTYASYSVT